MIAVQAASITDVGIDGVGVTPSGASVGPPTARALALLQTAHQTDCGRRCSSGTGTRPGSRRRSRRGCSRARENRAAVASKLANLVRVQGWNGITVDLESLSRADGPGLVAFAAALHARLPHGDLLAVDVAAC